MGQEIFSGSIRIPKFLGMNTKISDTSIHIYEASSLYNVNFTEESLDQRNGSTKLNAVAFKEKTNTTAKAITGLYSTNLNGNLKQVGTGGDAFRALEAGAWNSYTGSITITDNVDNLCSFATFFDNAAAEVIIGCPTLNAPFKWTGTGNASTLSSTPGNFKFPVVHKGRLWVVINDIVYWSAYNNCESWDTVYDLQRFAGDGEDISGIYPFNDRLVVFKPSSIHVISGSSVYDISVETIITGDGCASGFSIQEVESRRYGNILVFLSTEGMIKGFNGSKNLLLLGDPIKSLYDSMNRGRLNKCVSANYTGLNQYWLSMSYGSGSTHNRILGYDYFNDRYSADDGRPLSTNFYHTGITANAMAIFEDASNIKYLVTGDYSGFALRQDNGQTDSGTTLVTSSWTSKKIDFEAPEKIKLLTDLSVVTTQSSDTHLGLTITTPNSTGTGSASITTAGSKWGGFLWGTGTWSGTDTKYTRAVLTSNLEDGSVFGRYFVAQISHTTAAENMRVEELILGATDLGGQPEFVEA